MNFRTSIIGLMSIFVFGVPALAESTTITLLHTNDLHSRYRPEKNRTGLGGIARIKTTVDQIRKSEPNTLLVDAGDWSEGSIYYTDGAGRASIEMMDQIGYDFAVLGNHDWLNGPNVLLEIFEKAQPKIRFLSANLNLDAFPNQKEFRKWVLPYAIKTVAGVKIAFIGLSTYEYIYDKFFSPIAITEPSYIARELAYSLKADGQADFVVAISHNSISANEKILSQAPSVDLVISGHKHRKLTRPIFVTRNDADPGWVVETGCWGQYLGRVDLKVTDGKVELADYKLIQMDSSVPEDPKVLETINRIERKVEEARGPIFQDVIGHSEMEFSRTGLNNPMGNIVMDAYLRTIQADFALDSIQFINGKLYPGPIRSVDVFNAVPAIFNPATGKSWTVKTVPISGRTLKWFLYLFYSTSRIASLDLLTTSGIRFDYDTIIYQNMLFNNFGPQPLLAGTMAIPPVKNIIIRGEPIEMDRMYQMVTGQGMIEAIEFVNKNIYEAIPLDSMVDHGIESWRVLAEYIQTISPLNRQKFSPENRIRILVGDLGVYPEDIEWTPYEGNSTTRNFGRLKVRIKNYGASDTFDPTFFSGSQLHVFQDQNGRNTAIDPEYVEIGSPQSLGSIKTGESTEVQMDLDFKPIPGSNSILVRIDGDRSDSNISNNEAVFWLE